MHQPSASWAITASLLFSAALLTACTAEPVQESPPPMEPVAEAEPAAEEDCEAVAETEAAAPQPDAGDVPAAALSPESAPSAVEKTWSVGIVSFQDEAKAKQAADKLSAKGYAVEIFLTTLADQHWYRVTFGGFKSKPDARTFRDDARKQGHKTAWLVPPV